MRNYRSGYCVDLRNLRSLSLMNEATARHRPVVDGAKLLRRRYEQGLSQPALAQLANSSPQHICDIEHGRRNARPPVLARLARALKCSVADLLQEPSE